MIDSEHLLQQHFQLHFAPGAARLDVGQYPLQVAHAERQLLHLAESLMHFFQPLRHLLERGGQARLQGGVQFFIDRLAHFFQARAVVRLQIADLAFQRGAHFQHALGVRFGQLGQGLVGAVGKARQALRLFFAPDFPLRLYLRAQAVELLQGGGLELRQAGGQVLPRRLRRRLQLQPHFAFDPVDALQALRLVLLHQRQGGGAVGTAHQARAQQQQDQQDDDGRERRPAAHRIRARSWDQSGLLRIQSAVW